MSDDPMEPLVNVVRQLQTAAESLGLEFAAPPIIMPNLEGGPHMVQAAFVLTGNPAALAPQLSATGDSLDGGTLSAEEAAAFEEMMRGQQKAEEEEAADAARANLEKMIRELGETS